MTGRQSRLTVGERGPCAHFRIFQGSALPLAPSCSQFSVIRGHIDRPAVAPEIHAEYGNRVTTAMLTEGGYIEHESGTWWTPSGRTVVDPAHFYLPVATTDPFGNTTSVAYDAHDLFATTVTDAIGNTVTADIDYHLLAAWRITDPNGNRSAARFDRLGRVVATAVMGKAGSTDGDTLDDPTARFTYVTDAFSSAGKPNYAKAEVRETHGDAQTRWQVSYAYSDGMGRVAMTKAQAEPGMAPQRDAQGQLVRDNNGALVYAAAATRWVGTGRAVFDNKGQPVKQYEPWSASQNLPSPACRYASLAGVTRDSTGYSPFSPSRLGQLASLWPARSGFARRSYFSSVPDFEDEDELVATGVTPILRYDPLGRLTRTDLPNGSYARSEFDAWTQMAWDPNDTSGEAGNAWTAARLPGATPAPSAEELRAAELALEHADTPATSHIDALGRVFLVQARLTAIGATPQKIVETRTEMDIEGQVLAVRDGLGSDAGNGVLGRVCAESRHAIGGQAIWSSHIDSGLGYVLSDVAGAPLYAWDALGHRVRTQVDALRRVTHVWVKKGSDAEWLSQRIVYGEAVEDPETFNLRGKVLYHFDGAGLVASGTYDFKGNLLSSWRRLATTYDAEPSWTALAAITDPAEVLAEAESLGLLESETFSKGTTYDALNRPISMTQPDASVILPSFNEAGLLEGVDVKIRGAATATPFVENIDYDVKGRREKIEYGNGTTTTYDYDPLTYRLTRLKTTRASDSAILQNLFYTYDPVGNILAIADSAHDSVFFAGQQVTPSALYEYDALYRLVRATGREHAGGIGDDQRDQNDLPLWNLPHPNDAQALRNYVEQYEYDLVGNIERMVHTAVNSAVGSWTRRYAYGNDPFPGTPPQTPLIAENNRLHSTSLPGDSATGPFTATYTHDANGNMVTMPHLAAIEYTYTNQMREADLGGGGTAYYTYDASGERVRKVIQRLGTTREERIYLGGWELYRKRQGAEAEIVLERETLHVMDDARRIAMVETKTVDADVQGTLTVVSRIRYQLDNHLGTATLEVDGTGLVISYEEYHPYGTSAYRSARSGVEVSEKRYRYTGKERDEETGFGYHSARYYVPWLARWTSADPKGMVDGPNLYVYCSGNPVVNHDPDGRQECPSGNCHVPRAAPVSHLRSSDLDSLPPVTFEDIKRVVAVEKADAQNYEHNTGVTLQVMEQRDVAEGNFAVCHNGCHGLTAIKGVGMTTQKANASAGQAMKGIAVAVMAGAAVPSIAASGLVGGFVMPTVGGHMGGVLGYETARSFGASKEVAGVFGFVGSVGGAYAGGSFGSFLFAESRALAPITEDLVLQSTPLPRSQAFSELGSLEVVYAPPGAFAGGPSALTPRATLRSVLESELGESLAGQEYFIHGTTASVAENFELAAGRPLFTTLDRSVARLFAARSVLKAGGGDVGGVAVVLPRDVVSQLRSLRLLTVRPISDMPQHLEWVFSPGTRDTIITRGTILPLPPGTL